MGILIAIFGGLFAGAGAAKLLHMAIAQSRGRRTIGRVIRLERLPELAGQPTYTPVVEFEAEGRRVEVRGWRSFPPGYQVGEEVAVSYPPGHPEAAQILSRRERWVAACFLAGGMVFVLLGVFVALRSD